MKKYIKSAVYWTPRITTILFALFISIFAFDVFENNLSFWQTVLALLIHLIPTFLIFLILALSWKWEWIGGAAYILLSFIYIFWAWNRFPLVVFLLIPLPLFLIGVLFLIGWFNKKQIKSTPSSE